MLARRQHSAEAAGEKAAADGRVACHRGGNPAGQAAAAAQQRAAAQSAYSARQKAAVAGVAALPGAASAAPQAAPRAHARNSAGAAIPRLPRLGGGGGREQFGGAAPREGALQVLPYSLRYRQSNFAAPLLHAAQGVQVLQENEESQNHQVGALHHF